MKPAVTNSLILLLVASVTAFVAWLGMRTLNLAPLETLFLCFIAAVIAIQLVPAVLLFSGMLKGLFSSRAEKRSEL